MPDVLCRDSQAVACMQIVNRQHAAVCSGWSPSSCHSSLPLTSLSLLPVHCACACVPAGMNITQVGIWLSFVIVPSLLTLLPATRAGVLWSVSFAQQALLQTWGSGVTFPPMHLGLLAYILPPLVSCYFAGMTAAGCLGVRPRHIEVLRDAVRSADAYMRLAAARQPLGPGPSPYKAPEAVGGRRAGPAMPQYGGSVFASSSSLTLEQELSESESDEGSHETSSSASTAQVAADAFKTLAMVSR